MRLRSVRLKGYKRFGAESEFRVSGPLQAIVGPNEAGKTSFLRALTHLTNPRAFDRREYTGRVVPANEPVVVEAKYDVEAEDTAALSDLLDPKTRYVLHVERRADETQLRSGLTPSLQRDLGPRQSLIARLRTLVDAGSLRVEAEEEDDQPDTTQEERATGLASIHRGLSGFCPMHS